jgi:cytochrome c
MMVAILLASAGEAAAQGSAEQGEDLFKKRCKACHDIGDGAKTRVGPALTGIVGRKAAAEGYPYSGDLKALGEKGFVWDDKTLDKYLENPKSVVANGKMIFPGLKDEQDRKDLITYLKKFAK